MEGTERGIKNRMPDKFVSVAIIYDPVNKTVLLQHRDNKPGIFGPNKWGLFGGHGEENETPKQTMTRELREELSIQFDESEFEPINDYISVYELRRYVFRLNRAADTMQIKLNEGQGFAWIPIDQVLGYDLSAGPRKDLEIFLQAVS